MNCSVENCEKPIFCKDVCNMHYSRIKRHGDPNIKIKAGNPPGDQLANVMRHVIKDYNETGCWAWGGATKAGGYGVITLSIPKRHNERVYRFLYYTLRKPIPEGLHLDHFMYPQDGCIGPNCCNPDHLKPVTPKENSLRSESPMALNARKTHCNRGHEYTEENTYRRASRPHERECRTCKDMRGKW